MTQISQINPSVKLKNRGAGIEPGVPGDDGHPRDLCHLRIVFSSFAFGNEIVPV